MKNATPLQKVFLFMGVVFALLSIAAGVFGYLITGPARGDVVAEPVAVTLETAQRLDDRIRAAQQEIDEAG